MFLIILFEMCLGLFVVFGLIMFLLMDIIIFILFKLFLLLSGIVMIWIFLFFSCLVDIMIFLLLLFDFLLVMIIRIFLVFFFLFVFGLNNNLVVLRVLFNVVFLDGLFILFISFLRVFGFVILLLNCKFFVGGFLNVIKV